MAAIATQGNLSFDATSDKRPAHVRKLNALTFNALGGIVSFFGDIRRANEAVSTFEYLSHLSDSELAARGLERSKLAQVAYDECFSRRD